MAKLMGSTKLMAQPGGQPYKEGATHNHNVPVQLHTSRPVFQPALVLHAWSQTCGLNHTCCATERLATILWTYYLTLNLSASPRFCMPWSQTRGLTMYAMQLKGRLYDLKLVVDGLAIIRASCHITHAALRDLKSTLAPEGDREEQWEGLHWPATMVLGASLGKCSNLPT